MSSTSSKAAACNFVFVKEKVVSAHLQLNDEQRKAIRIRYDQHHYEELTFDADNPQQQQQALQKLAELKLNASSLAMLEMRKKMLYQCVCGHIGRSALVPKAREFSRSSSFGGMKVASSQRRMPYPFTECLAHIEVTIRVKDEKIVKISGISDHNPACEEAGMNRLPAIPLHEHVYEVAIEQLEDGASLTAVQEKNQQMMLAASYRGMGSYDARTANSRYNLLSSDNATLYNKFSRRLGIHPRKEPQYNINDWLNPQHKDFKPEIREAVFHYQARTEKNERFKICITTAEMDQAALDHDGTFGVCSQRVLLFIAMGVDKDNKGIPIALFLFSAPTRNRVTHAGYNTEVLAELFLAWNHHLSEKFNISFEPYSALTDTDTKERGALLIVWPSTILLICKFHLCQCWTNNRKKMRCQGSDGMKGIITVKLFQLENELVASMEHAAALALIRAEQVFYSSLAEQEETRSIAEAAQKYLNYLLDYWMSQNLWHSWSECGRRVAAARIGVSVHDMIPTTNHLESFNCILKRKFICSWLRMGKRLRVDMLILILITRILPDIFARRRTILQHKVWLTEQFKDSANRVDLLEVQQHNAKALAARIVAWWPPDDSRQNAGEQLAKKGTLTSLTRPNLDSYAATCASSTTPDTRYELSIQCSGTAGCSCPDFRNNGEACKHLRALRLVLEALVLGTCWP
ncbi:hypothetical protein EV360DRAFT_88385 [Lentinula raphanica]|nr:hypothetical protein EV360DRAFT_88385 [Lentinula raphanica]